MLLGRRLLQAIAALWVVPARADPPPSPAPLQAFQPSTREEAAMLALTSLAGANSVQLGLGYTRLPSGENAGEVVLQLGAWMPYVFFPGIKVPKMGTIFIVDMRFQLLSRGSGMNDMVLVDQPVYEFSWGAVALGAVCSVPTASPPSLGQGHVQLGPVASIAVSRVERLLLTLSLVNTFSVGGNLSTLFVQPEVGYLLPRAFFLRSDPIWSFDWTRGGRATVPVNLGVGYAFTNHLLAFVQPEWITTGDGKNSVTVRLIVDYLGW